MGCVWQTWEEKDVVKATGREEKNGKRILMDAICKIDSQQEFAIWLRKLKQGRCLNLEGWDGEGDRREVQKGGNICILMADSC